jgi:hypothetical protein
MKSILFAVGVLAASSASAMGSSWSQTERILVPGAGRTASVSAPTGGLQTFGDEASFEAAVGDPGALSSESFDGGATPPGVVNTCNEPVNSSSNDPCFAPGDLIDGFSVTSTSGTGIVILGPQFLGPVQDSAVIGANSFADATIVTFDPPVTAISADYYGGSDANAVTVEAFDEGGGSLGAGNAQPSAVDTPQFLGLISDTPIASIVITAANDDGELFDNLRFGDVSTGPDDTIFADGFDTVVTVDPPTVSKAFNPATVITGSNSMLTITLSNTNAVPATLSADLVDMFPTGLVVATPADAATDCTDGTATATDGGDSVTLASGAQIPAGGSCTVTVSVTSAADGTYTNTIPAGGLQTDLGNSPADASADVTFTTGGTCDPAQLIEDPSFEASITGAGPWSTTSSNFGTVFCDEASCGNGGGTAAPHTGTVWAWFGGAAGAAEIGTATQSVTIPAGDSRFLNFWLWISSVGPGGGSFLNVNIDGNTVQTFAEPSDAEAGYTQRSIDVSSFADGGTHEIEFYYEIASNGLNSNFILDDVTLDCTPARPTFPLPANREPVGPVTRIR